MLSLLPSTQPQQWVRRTILAWTLFLISLIVWPLFSPGYLLIRDAVSTPRSYLTPGTWGIGSTSPRAVPQDVLIAVMSNVIDGGILVKVLIVASLLAASLGAVRLTLVVMPSKNPFTVLAQGLLAVTIAVWNPFVVERLLQGHWSLLTSYGAICWIILSVRDIHLRVSGGWPRLALALAASALTPTGSIIGALAATLSAGALCLPSLISFCRHFRVHRHTRSPGKNLRSPSPPLSPSRSCSSNAGSSSPTHTLTQLALVFLLSLTVCLPWLVAGILQLLTPGEGSTGSDPAAIPLFAARAEGTNGALSVVGSLLSLGGIWNADAVPPVRSSSIVIVFTFAFLAVLGLGMRQLGRRGYNPLVKLWSFTAIVVILLIAFGATEPGISSLQWIVAHIPGAGLLRDTQKWLILVLPTYVLLAGGAGRSIARLGQTELKQSAPPARSHHEEQCTPGVKPRQFNPSAKLAHNAPPADSTECSTVAHPSPNAHPAPKGRALPAARLALVAQPVQLGALIVCICALMLTIPTAPFAVKDALSPYRYPDAWQEIADTIAKEPGDVAIIPLGQFRRFEDSHGLPVLDPAARLLPSPVLNAGELIVGGITIRGEDTRARAVETALFEGASARTLAANGVRWIVVEMTALPRQSSPSNSSDPLHKNLAGDNKQHLLTRDRVFPGQSKNTLSQLELVVNDSSVRLYRVAGSVFSQPVPLWELAAAYTAHATWALVLLGGALGLVVRQSSRVFGQ